MESKSWFTAFSTPFEIGKSFGWGAKWFAMRATPLKFLVTSLLLQRACRILLSILSLTHLIWHKDICKMINWPDFASLKWPFKIVVVVWNVQRQQQFALELALINMQRNCIIGINLFSFAFWRISHKECRKLNLRCWIWIESNAMRMRMRLPRFFGRAMV